MSFDRPSYMRDYFRKRRKEPGYKRDRHLRERYGMTKEEFDKAVEKQGGCALCDREGALVVDHCHVTGKVRGIVCRSCNAAMGMAGDDPELLEKMVKWLQG